MPRHFPLSAARAPFLATLAGAFQPPFQGFFVLISDIVAQRAQRAPDTRVPVDGIEHGPVQGGTVGRKGRGEFRPVVYALNQD